MQSLHITNATRTLAEEQDEFETLDIFDEQFDGINHVTSLWEPTPEELQQLNEGCAIRLTIQGTIHPPVIVAIQPKQEG